MTVKFLSVCRRSRPRLRRHRGGGVLLGTSFAPGRIREARSRSLRLPRCPLLVEVFLSSIGFNLLLLGLLAELMVRDHREPRRSPVVSPAGAGNFGEPPPRLVGAAEAMCGIGGIALYAPVVQRSTSSHDPPGRHRGPDDEGFFLESYATVSASGWDSAGWRSSTSTPVTSRSPTRAATVQLVFNGEVYNFSELREALAARGHPFPPTRTRRSSSISIWSGRSLRRAAEGNVRASRSGTRAARAPSRARPLREEASLLRRTRSLSCLRIELKSLLRHPVCPSALNSARLRRYLALEYVPTPGAIIAGVEEAPGGSRPRWSAVDVARALLGPVVGGARPTPGRRVRRLRREQLRALRPSPADQRRPAGRLSQRGHQLELGRCLMVAAQPADAVKTFSVGFGERTSTRPSTRAGLPPRFGTDHHEALSRQARCWTGSPRLPTLDEPFADPRYCRPTCSPGSLAESVTVALGGDGSDELLAGYRRSWPTHWGRLPRSPPRSTARIVPLVDRLPVRPATSASTSS